MKSIWKLTVRIYVTAQAEDGSHFDQVLNSRESHWRSEKQAKRVMARYQSMIDELDFPSCMALSLIEIPLAD